EASHGTSSSTRTVIGGVVPVAQELALHQTRSRVDVGFPGLRMLPVPVGVGGNVLTVEVVHRPIKKFIELGVVRHRGSVARSLPTKVANLLLQLLNSFHLSIALF